MLIYGIVFVNLSPRQRHETANAERGMFGPASGKSAAPKIDKMKNYIRLNLTGGSFMQIGRSAILTVFLPACLLTIPAAFRLWYAGTV